MKLSFNRNNKKWFVTPVIQAINKYKMIENDEKIAVALSGGKDSLVLLAILLYLQRFSHLNFELIAIHIRVFNSPENKKLKDLCKNLSIPYFEGVIENKKIENSKSICSICSRLKRGELQKICNDSGVRKIAFGHHSTDVAETFLINLIQNKKLGSFCPKVTIKSSPLTIIRPLIYLDEKIIKSLFNHFELELSNFICPYENKNIRVHYKENIEKIEKLFKINSFSNILVDSLENLDESNIWKNSI